ncbi:MAG: hypothetical protein COB81_06605 [Flavobacteriaceae bacterium]|nr:MAG: hypothetical protein COB81_06605 [Flavobacteriaceae bacterium]
MFTQLKKIIASQSTGKKVLLLFVLTNCIYAYMLLVSIPKTLEFTPDFKLLDMMPLGYDLDFVKGLFDALGSKGRAVYLSHQLPVDFIYPLLFGIGYCLLMAYLLKKINKYSSNFFLLCLLPLVVWIADYCENLSIIYMLNNYPTISESTVGMSSFFSLVKSMTTTVYFVALLIVLVIVGIKKIRK